MSIASACLLAGRDQSDRSDPSDKVVKFAQLAPARKRVIPACRQAGIVKKEKTNGYFS